MQSHHALDAVSLVAPWPEVAQLMLMMLPPFAHAGPELAKLMLMMLSPRCGALARACAADARDAVLIAHVGPEFAQLMLMMLSPLWRLWPEVPELMLVMLPSLPVGPELEQLMLMMLSPLWCFGRKAGFINCHKKTEGVPRSEHRHPSPTPTS